MTTTTTRRRADMARPEKRGTRFRARIWNPYTQKYETIPNENDSRYNTFATEQAADIAQRAALAKLYKAYEDAGVDPVVKQRAAHPFRHVVQQWLPLLDGSRQTRTNRADTVRRLVARFGDTDINAIDEDDFRQYMRDMEDAGLAPHTIQLRLVVMRMVVDYAHRKGYLDADKDPVQGIKYKPYRLKEPGTLDDQNFILLTYYFPWWLEAAAYLGYDEGLRAGEVAGLTWKRLDIDSDNPRIVVQDVAEKDGTIRPLTKGRKTSTLTLTQRTVDALRRLRDLRPQDGPDDRVFRTPLGAPMIPRYIGDQMRAAWVASGLPGARLTFHSFRHSCATNMADAGVDMRTIMERMRHGDPKTTMAYIRAAGDRAQVEAIAMVEKMFAGRLQKPDVATVTALPAQMSPQQAAALQALLSTFAQAAA